MRSVPCRAGTAPAVLEEVVSGNKVREASNEKEERGERRGRDGESMVGQLGEN